MILTTIDDNDRGIYHHLVDVLTEEPGLLLVERVADIVGGINNLTSLVSIDGYTPLLTYLLRFVDNAESVYSCYESKFTNDYLLAHNLRNYGLTFQARENIKAQAEASYQAYVEHFLVVLKKLVLNGASFGEIVQKRKEYREKMDIEEPAPNKTNKNEESKMDEEKPTLDNTKTDKMDIEKRKVKLITKLKKTKLKGNNDYSDDESENEDDDFNESENSSSEDDLNSEEEEGIKSETKPELPTPQTLKGMEPAKPKVKILPPEPAQYPKEGKQNVLHIAIRYPHPKLITLLVESDGCNVNHKEINEYTPLDFLLKNYSDYG